MSETTGPSVLLRKDVIEALRRGTVPRRGLDLFAVGTDRFGVSLKEELDRCTTGGAGSGTARGALALLAIAIAGARRRRRVGARV